jgi:2-dehydro-3-deoxygalactonokinase
MGGELFSAVSQHTILNASVSGFPEQGNETMRYAMKCGYDAVKKYGFNRATYMVRALDLFSDASQEERNFFYEGVIHADILTGIQSCREFQTLDRICIAGKPVYFDIFNTLINYEKWNIPCSYIEAKEESFALRGFLELIKLS